MELISIEEELKKNPQLKLDDIKLLRDWIDQEKTAPTSLSDVQLALFLHCCDYDLETTKKTIKTNYRWRAEQPDYFTRRNFTLDSGLAHSLDTVSFLLLPKRSTADELIIVARIKDNDPKSFLMLESVKLFFMFMDMVLVKHGSSNGVVIIYDCEPITFALARKTQISTLRALLHFLQEAVSFKVNAIHYMNVNAAFNFVFQLFKPFVASGLINKLHFHSPGSSTIFADLAPNSVPKHFNGEEETSFVQMHEKMKEGLKSFQPWFEKEEASLMTFMQSLESEKQKNGDLSETIGSFRQLDFD
nr:PREDICTED: alpha-tocopherol transfer protein-like [Bemisia tabaci]